MKTNKKLLSIVLALLLALTIMPITAYSEESPWSIKGSDDWKAALTPSLESVEVLSYTPYNPNTQEKGHLSLGATFSFPNAPGGRIENVPGFSGFDIESNSIHMYKGNSVFANVWLDTKFSTPSETATLNTPEWCYLSDGMAYTTSFVPVGPEEHWEYKESGSYNSANFACEGDTLEVSMFTTGTYQNELEEYKSYDPSSNVISFVISDDIQGKTFKSNDTSEKTAAIPKNKKVTYNGKKQFLTAGEGYTLSGKTSGTNAGTYKATANLKAGYIWSDGTKSPKVVVLTIGRRNNPLTAKGKTVKVSAKTLKKKKKVTVKRSKAIAVSNVVGELVFKKTKGNKKITVAKNGKITVKKGLKKGKYKVKVKILDSGNKNFKSGVKNVTVTIKVK